MKHYSASLVGQANQVDDTTIDSRLQIGADDSLVITNANDGTIAFSTSGGDGLYILRSNKSDAANLYYLDGSGQERLLTDIDGTEVVEALHVPISNAAGDAYVDSQITQSVVGDGGTPTITIGDAVGSTTAVTGILTVGGDATIAGSLTVQGDVTYLDSLNTRIEDQWLELNVPDTSAGAATPPATAGILFANDVAVPMGTTPTSFAGIRWAGTEFEWNATAAADGTGGTWNPFGSDVNYVGGEGIAIATSGTIDGVTATTAAPIISVDLTTTAAGEGGLEFDVVAGDTNNTLGIAQAGVTEQMLNVPGTAGAADDILTLVDATAGTFAWVSRAIVASAGASGTVRKVTEDITASGTADRVHVVDTTTTNSQVSTTDIGINVVVAVYEDASVGQDNSSLSQVIPQSIVVTASNVTVTLPAGGIKGRIVITG